MLSWHMKFWRDLKTSIHKKVFNLIPSQIGHIFCIFEVNVKNYQTREPIYHRVAKLQTGKFHITWKPEIKEFLDNCDGYHAGDRIEHKNEDRKYVRVYPLYFRTVEDAIYFKLAFSSDDVEPTYDWVDYDF